MHFSFRKKESRKRVKYEEGLKKWNLLIQNWVFITLLHYFQSSLHLIQYTYWDVFAHRSKLFLNLSILKPVSISAIFCFTSSTWAKHLLLRTFLIQGNKQTKDALGKIRWIGGWGTGIMLFKAKTCWSLSAVWAGVSLGNGQMCWKSLKKKSLKLNAASHNNASWYTDTDGFLKHSPSEGILHYKGPVLQKIMVIFWVSPHIQHLTL